MITLNLKCLPYMYSSLSFDITSNPNVLKGYYATFMLYHCCHVRCRTYINVSELTLKDPSVNYTYAIIRTHFINLVRYCYSLLIRIFRICVLTDSERMGPCAHCSECENGNTIWSLLATRRKCVCQ